MTLRCPQCGSKRVIFLSTTDGTAVGSTDQRYLCKDCGYRGSLILDTFAPKADSKSFVFPKTLIVLDLILFFAVVALLFTGGLDTAFGLALLGIWVLVFIATVVYFSLRISQGTEDWYQYGMNAVSGAMVGLVVGIIFSLDIYAIILLMTLSIMGLFAINWMFIDTSEDEITRDLKRLHEEIAASEEVEE